MDCPGLQQDDMGEPNSHNQVHPEQHKEQPRYPIRNAAKYKMKRFQNQPSHEVSIQTGPSLRPVVKHTILSKTRPSDPCAVTLTFSRNPATPYAMETLDINSPPLKNKR